MKKVSVIIPFYGVEKYLEDCLKSVQNQTHCLFEVVLVNDGSRDGSEKIAKKFVNSDKRFKLVCQENRGLNSARETGFRNCSGDFITFLDSDDVLNDNFLEVMLDQLESEEVDFAVCQYQKFENLDNIKAIKREQILYETIEREEVLRRFLVGNSEIEDLFLQTAWGKMFRRETIEKIDFAKSNYRINEDEFMSPMFYAEVYNSITVVKSPLYLYRENPNSIMASVNKEYNNSFQGKKISRLKMIENMMNFRLELFPNFSSEIIRNFSWHFYHFSREHLSGARNNLNEDEAIKILARNIDLISFAFKKYPPNGVEKSFYDFIFKNSPNEMFGFRDTQLKISIIIPVYNTEKYIKDCLDSIKNQTYLNFEVIIVDDGSSDGSGYICDTFSLLDQRFRVFHIENKGVSHARNFGIKKSCGYYVSFVDSDDYLEYDALEKMSNFTQNGKNDIVSCSLFLKKDDTLSKQDGLYLGIPVGDSFTKNELSQSELNTFLNGMNYPVAKLYKSKMIKNNKILFPEGIRFGEDLVFVVKSLFMADRIASHEDGVYIYRNDSENSSSATRTISNKLFDFALALEQIYTFMKENNLIDKRTEEAFKYGVITHSLYILKITNYDQNINKKVYNFIKDNLFKKYNISQENKYIKGEMKIVFEKILNSSYREYYDWLLSGGYFTDKIKECFAVIESMNQQIYILNSKLERLQSLKGSIRNVAGASKRFIKRRVCK